MAKQLSRHGPVRDALRSTAAVAFVLTVTAATAGCGDHGKATDSGHEASAQTPIVIGNVGTTSGLIGSHYGVMQKAVLAWADEVNHKGGIGGHPVRVEVADDGNDPAKNLNLVREMVEQKGVVAFVGVPSANTQSGSVKYLEEKGVPVIGGVTGDEPWGESPILFPQGFTEKTKSSALMYAVATTGKTKFAWVETEEHAREPGESHTQEIGEALERDAKETKVQLAYVKLFDPAKVDYNDVCSSAKRAGVEAMTIVAEFNLQAKLMTACAAQQFNPIYVTTGTTTDQRLVDLAGKNMEGAVGIARTAPWMADQPADLVVYRKVMAANGLQPAGGTMSGWASGRIFEEAVKHINGDITSAAVVRALRGLDGQNLNGLVAPLDFGSSPTEPNIGSKCFWTLVVKDGKWTPSRTGQVCMK
jgi:branched-chain amino acid transport system substrate-binding protein